MGEHGEVYRIAEENATEFYQSNEMYYADLAKISMDSLKYMRGLDITLKELVGKQKYDEVKNKAASDLESTNALEGNLARSNDYIEPSVEIINKILNWLNSNENSNANKLSSKDKKRLNELQKEISKISKSEEVEKVSSSKELSFRDGLKMMKKRIERFLSKGNKPNSKKKNANLDTDKDKDDNKNYTDNVPVSNKDNNSEASESEESSKLTPWNDMLSSTEDESGSDETSSSDLSYYSDTSESSAKSELSKNVSDNENNQSNENVQNTETTELEVEYGADDKTIEEKIRKITNINSIERAIKENFITPVLYDEKPSSEALSICCMFSRFLRDSSDKFNETEIVKQHNAGLLEEDLQLEKLSDEERIKIIDNFKSGKYTSDYGGGSKSKLTYDSLFVSFRAMLRVVAIMAGDNKFVNVDLGTSLFSGVNNDANKNTDKGNEKTNKLINLGILGTHYEKFTVQASKSNDVKIMRQYVTDHKEEILNCIGTLITDANKIKDFKKYFEEVISNRNIDIGKLDVINTNSTINGILRDIIMGKALFCEEDKKNSMYIKNALDNFDDKKFFSDKKDLKEEADKAQNNGGV